MADGPSVTQTDLSSTQPQQHDSTNAAKSTTPSVLNPSNFPQTLITTHTHTELRYTPLDIPAALAFTRSPTAGANVLFLGTTRNNFDDRPVSRLSYSAYPALALKSLSAIAEDIRNKHGLEKVYIVHRLGEVGIEEESIAVSVSSGHRQAGWKGAEEILERVKQRAEIWKREWFGDTGEVEVGVWRANKDRDATGRPVEDNSADIGNTGFDAHHAAKLTTEETQMIPPVQTANELAGAHDATALDAAPMAAEEHPASSAKDVVGHDTMHAAQETRSSETAAAPTEPAPQQDGQYDTQSTTTVNSTTAPAGSATAVKYQTSQDLDDDIAKYMATLAEKLKI